MKILLCNHRYFLSGGPERYMFRVKELLESRGHRVIPFSYRFSMNEKTEYSIYFANPPMKEDRVYFSDLKMNFLERIKYFGKMIYNIEAKKKIKEVIKKEKVDFCYTLQLANCLYPSIIDGCMEMGIPVVSRFSDFQLFCPAYVFSRNGDICEDCKKGYHWAVFHRCIKDSSFLSLAKVFSMYVHRLLGARKRIDAFIAPSMFLKKKVIEYGITASRIFHIPSFISIKYFEPSYFDDRYILYSGMILKYKGVRYLIDAFKNIKDKNISLKIAGSSSDGEKERLEDYVFKRGIKNIFFLGHKTGEGLRELYQKTMFVVFPSIWYENMPNVIIESMAYGKPVIGSNLGSIPELIKDGETGLLFEPGNADDLAEKIQWMVEHPKERQAMGLRARELVEKECNPELHYKRLIAVYETALRKHGKGIDKLRG